MATASPPAAVLPDRTTMAAFAAVVFIAGGNVVAVRFSNQELPPFFAAGFRFAIAGLLLLAVVAARRIPLPRHQDLLGSTLFGLLGFGGAFALGYWALQQMPAAIGGLFFASVPLITLFLARIHGLERLRWRGIVGSGLTILGIAVLLSAPVTGSVPIGSVLAMIGAALCFSEATIVVKKFPPSHPVATNGLAMAVGASVLLAISLVSGEVWSIPSGQTAWLVFGYLVLIGSIGAFSLYLFTLKRWTASGVTYQFVLMPFVAALLALWLLDEAISIGLVVGGIIVLFGVYLGAFTVSRDSEPASIDSEAIAQQCSTT